MNEQIFNKDAYSLCIKKAVAFGFWKDICGKRFAEFSKPVDIKGKTLIIAVRNPSVMQELIFYKTMLLEKIKNYFLPLNIPIEDIKYDYKIWNKVVSRNTCPMGDDSLEYYEEEEIKEIPLNKFEEEEIKKVTNTVSNLAFLDDKHKDEMKKNIINSFKVNKIRKKDIKIG